ncbi:unannotated protein [freshwater metagenome]|uniref:Unannotated protein n=1 Tax=freshwater metagenome TaxID=449393 RepID=A0A6J7KIW0_9ZZZZ|nr:LysM peptidoglycan-binding domain-containing protein [Actinomycetota bacterium]
MGREVFDATAAVVASKLAITAVIIAFVVIFPALLAEILDRIGKARALASFLHRISPPIARRVATVVLAASFVTTLGAHASAADDTGSESVRRWLDSTATTQPAPDSSARPAGTWYEDPGDPSGALGPSGGIDFDDLNTHSSSTSLPTPTTTFASVTPTSRVSATSTTKRRPRRSTRPRSSSNTSAPLRTPLLDPEFLPSDSLIRPRSLDQSAGSAPLLHSVIHGDSLWGIAAGRLPSTASDQEIDLEWRSIYALNKVLIGSNPSMIFPGQILELPPLTIT